MTSSKQRAIADEFGLPFWEVLKGFADDGLSIKATADVLEYSHSAFRRLVERHGKKHWFKVGHSSLVPKQEKAERRGGVLASFAGGAESGKSCKPQLHPHRIPGRH